MFFHFRGWIGERLKYMEERLRQYELEPTLWGAQRIHGELLMLGIDVEKVGPVIVALPIIWRRRIFTTAINAHQFQDSIHRFVMASGLHFLSRYS
jgi:hypothetical protein